ncbi:tetratricopeptide repeat protein [Rhodospirillaceae bacterium KN72]|uniref:Tetratricopeptide repeat protein n=1 Tax=Pacificispira spongiicola TaxID=2729598 RepID=A0A7Y0E3K7_9PROT|nr:tetratricopeptide repeat protein [Pacificispira spongiicola]NMM45826.1 tetratricopeptide repeat protein [Pacificispira spongiicola]
MRYPPAIRGFAAAALVCLGVLAVIGTPVQSRADQNDPRLGEFFEILLNAPLMSPQAQLAQAQIWTIWLDAPSASGRVLMEQGLAQMQSGAIDDAVETFDALISLEPRFAEAWNKRATVNFMAGNYADAMADIEETLSLEPRHFGAQSGKGLVLDAMGEKEAALEALEKALRINPHMPQILLLVEDLKKNLRGQQL